MRVFIATFAGLVALTALPVQSAPIPRAKVGPPHSTPSLRSSSRPKGADTAIGAPVGRITGALALGPLRSEVVGERSISAVGLVEPAKTDRIELSDQLTPAYRAVGI
jgi:hypothetical protein